MDNRMIGKSIKKIAATCIALACYASAYVVWDGTYSTAMYNSYEKINTFEISTPAQLAGLSRAVADGKSFYGKKVVLTADIYLNKTENFLETGISKLTNWSPIGRQGSPFYGTFDGKGHTIYGLRSTTEGSSVGMGLFGYTRDAVIRNLNLKYARVSNTYTGVAAGIVAEGYSTVIHNVHGENIDVSVSVDTNRAVGGLAARFSGFIDSSSIKATVTGRDSVGGLVGHFTQGGVRKDNFLTEDTKGLIKACSFEGTVKGWNTIGGLAGYSEGSIISSSAKGTIKGEHKTVSGSFKTVRAGGLAGKHIGDIQMSSFKGDVSSSDSIGGLVGLISGQVVGSAPASCSFSGTVTGWDNYVGGIAGKAESVLNVCAEGDVSASINSGEFVGGVVGEVSSISSSYHINGKVKGSKKVGGVAGYAKIIRNSYHDNGPVDGYTIVGGLAGYADSVFNSHANGNVSSKYGMVGGLVGSAIKVTGSYSIGDVVGSTSSVGGLAGSVSGSVRRSMSMGQVAGKDSVGGLVGRFYGTAIEDAYSRGNVSGTKYVGGLVGVGKDTLTRTYAVGVVTGTSDYGCIAGGVISSKSYKSTNTYYDSDSCSSATYTTVGTKTSKSKIASSSPFTSWSMETWMKISGSYPILFSYVGSFADAKVTLDIADEIYYDSTAHTPEVIVQSAGLIWPSSYYTVKYSNNINIGTASVEVCGKKANDGCVTLNFKIVKKLDLVTVVVIGEDKKRIDSTAVERDTKYYVPDAPAVPGKKFSYYIDWGTLQMCKPGMDTCWMKATQNLKIESVYDYIYYTIRFLNGDSVLSNTTYRYEQTPSCGIIPTKANSARYTYQFAGWTPAIKPVTKAQDYKAVYDSLPRKYTITFKVGTKVFSEVELAYNSTPTAPAGILPEKTAKYTYSLTWDKKFAKVTGNATYTATIDSTLNKYAVKFMNGTDLLDSQMVAYGEVPEFAGEEPVKTNDDYDYTFKGWSPEIEAVTEEVVYTAVFDSVSTHTTRTDVRLAGLNLSVSADAGKIQISAAPIGANYRVMDVQGRILKNGMVQSENFSIPKAQSGTYLVKVGSYSKAVKIR